MKNKSSRRLFLSNSVMAATSIALVSSSSVVHALTMDDSPFEGYNAYAENKTDLRNSILFDKSVIVKGVVYDDALGQLPVSNATIEVWHLSPGSSKYRHRAKLTTNASGAYQFITDVPNKESGMNPRIYFKISKAERTFFTELSMNNHGAHVSEKHWAQHQVLGEALFPKKEVFLNQTTITFNLSI